jgi:hypothetical protein
MGDIAKKKDNCEIPLISAIIRAKKNVTTLSKLDSLAWKEFRHSKPLNQLDPLVLLSMDLTPPKGEKKVLNFPPVSTDPTWKSIHGSQENLDQIIAIAKGNNNLKYRTRILHLNTLIGPSKYNSSLQLTLVENRDRNADGIMMASC